MGEAKRRKAILGEDRYLSGDPEWNKMKAARVGNERDQKVMEAAYQPARDGSPARLIGGIATFAGMKGKKE